MNRANVIGPCMAISSAIVSVSSMKVRNADSHTSDNFSIEKRLYFPAAPPCNDYGLIPILKTMAVTTSDASRAMAASA